MRTQARVRNPFQLMLNPEQVLAAMHRSEKLGQLNRRTCHPLDKPAPLGNEGERQGAIQPPAASSC